MTRRASCILTVAALAVTVTSAPASASSNDVANPFAATRTQKYVIHFVPLDDRARRLLRRVVPVAQKWTRRPAEITDVPTPRVGWTNTRRHQLNARAVMTDLLARFQKARGARAAFIVPVSSGSLYDPDTPLDFVFGLRGPANRQQAVAMIGTAPMRGIHAEREPERLMKMTLRYMGDVLCRLPRNSNPKSVLYQPISSDRDLDAMVARLPRRC
jgi:hypothetical protein